MVKVACEKCGNRYLLDDAAVPPSGKVIRCEKCGHEFTARRTGAVPPPIPGDAFRGGGTDLSDLPAPARRSALTAAKAGVASPPNPLDVADLPAPRGPRPLSASAYDEPDSDLPVPVGPTSRNELPDLLSPVGPSPGGSAQDLPDLLAPVGPGQAGAAGPDLPAPKGFFDDGLSPKQPAAAGPDLPAPKGFFDDGLSPKQPAAAGPDLPAPKGFFDDIVAPKQPAAFDSGESSGSMSLDLDDIELGGGGTDEPLDLGDPISTGGGERPFGLDALEIDSPAAPAGQGAPSVPLELPTPGGPDDGYGSIELPELDTPDEAGPGVVTFARPAQAPKPAGAASAEPRRAPAYTPFGVAPDADVELDIDTSAPPGVDPVRGAMARPRRGADAGATGGLGGKKKVLRAAAVVVGVAALGAGAYFGYDRWQGSKERTATIERSMADAARHLATDAPGHWDQAAAAANHVLGIDPEHADALGIAAEASFAAILDEGIVRARRNTGDSAIEKIREISAQGDHAEKGLALQYVLQRRPQEAVSRLRALLETRPQDTGAALYLAWAYAAGHDHRRAIQAFDAVLKQSPKRLPALYGRAQSQLALGLVKEARESFLDVIRVSREDYKLDHVGALVGIAQLEEVERFGDRENRYLQILERRELDKVDPRAVSRAWALAGDEALRAGRTEEARRRYGRALELHGENLGAFVGEGKASLAEGNIEGAREWVTRVLTLDPHHIDATLALAEVEIADNQPNKAEEMVARILDREPKVENREILARAHMARAAIFEASPDTTAQAESEYRQAIELAPAGDISPMLALSHLYAKQGRGEDAIAVLEPLKDRARQDPAIAVTLGVAFLQGGEPAGAEESFRKALALRPGDVEATFQLGQALYAQKRHDEAIKITREAYESNEAREDIGLRLGTMYEGLARDEEARALYLKLLSGRSPSLNVRARAGRFFARVGDSTRAIALGESIQQEQPRHPTGLFLAGEAAFSRRNFQDAREHYNDAVRLDPQPQYLEALARASESLQLYDDAITFYQRAIDGDKNYLAPRLGIARVRLVRNEFRRALDVLEASKELAPRNPAIWAGIGKSHVEMKNPKEALEPLQRAVALDDGQAENHYLLGKTFFDLDRPAEAAGSLGRAVRLADGDERWLQPALLNLGYANRATGNKAGAIKAFSDYLERVENPNSPEARDARRMMMRLQAR